MVELRGNAGVVQERGEVGHSGEKKDDYCMMMLMMVVVVLGVVERVQKNPH